MSEGLCAAEAERTGGGPSGEACPVGVAQEGRIVLATRRSDRGARTVEAVVSRLHAARVVRREHGVEVEHPLPDETVHVGHAVRVAYALPNRPRPAVERRPVERDEAPNKRPVTARLPPPPP